MTRREQTGTRDLTFNTWLRDALPDSSTGQMVSDIDFYIFNYKKKEHLIVETKTYNAPLKTWQEIMYSKLQRWVSEGGNKEGWKFKGFYLIQFEKTFFDDGKVYLNGEESSKEEIIETLSL